MWGWHEKICYHSSRKEICEAKLKKMCLSTDLYICITASGVSQSHLLHHLSEMGNAGLQRLIAHHDNYYKQGEEMKEHFVFFSISHEWPGRPTNRIVIIFCDFLPGWCKHPELFYMSYLEIKLWFTERLMLLNNTYI